MTSEARPHPRVAVQEACERWGEADVARRSAALIGAALDPELVGFLGGVSAANESWMSSSANRYWPRVWGARALLYAWDPAAIEGVIAGFTDDQWRVREMCAKVAALREISEAADAAAGLTTDETARVRAAALRVLGAVGEAEHAPAAQAALADPERTVRAAAGAALDQLEERLDRTFARPST